MHRAGIAAIAAGWLAAAVCAGAAVAGGTEQDPAITVIGNRHIGADVIRSFFHAGPDNQYDAAARDAALKALYASDLFTDVKISHEGNRILVVVVENPTIGVVAFEGNRKLKDADLKAQVQSKANGPLSRELIQSDVVRILDLYRAHGYFNAQVAPKTIERKPGDNGRVNLVFEIKEGEKLAVKDIAFTGNSAFSQVKLRGVVKSGVSNPLSFVLDNDIYDADRIENDTDLVRRFYLAHGYPDVRVSSAARYDASKKGAVVAFTKSVEALAIALARGGEPFASVVPQIERHAGRRIVDVSYRIEQGRRVYIERIQIHGNAKTRDDVIRREFDVGEGDAYNRSLVDRGERHLKALGYFKSVKIVAAPGSAPDRVVLDVAVEEQQTGNFWISGGYSTSDGFLASVTISDTNFLGIGDIAKTSLTYGQYARGFDVAFTDPWFLGQRLSVGGELFGRQTFANSNQAFNTSLYGAKFSAGTPITDNLGVT